MVAVTEKIGENIRKDGLGLYSIVFKEGYFYNLSRGIIHQTKKRTSWDLTSLLGIYYIDNRDAL